tara:strand:+ start:159 stop:680 length:522 start_codon:yes stop_codon:yes gene_type:complete
MINDNQAIDPLHTKVFDYRITSTAIILVGTDYAVSLNLLSSFSLVDPVVKNLGFISFANAECIQVVTSHRKYTNFGLFASAGSDINEKIVRIYTLDNFRIFCRDLICGCFSSCVNRDTFAFKYEFHSNRDHRSFLLVGFSFSTMLLQGETIFPEKTKIIFVSGGSVIDQVGQE